MKKISGADAQRFLNTQLEDAKNGLATALAPYDPDSTFRAYIETYRAIEEFINLPMFGLDDQSLEQEFVTLRLDNLDPARLMNVRARLLQHLSKEVVARLMIFIAQSAAMFMTFAIHGMHEAAAGLQSVGHAVGYFQSRRRHLLALLYCMPSACKGNKKFIPTETLAVFLPLVEHAGIPITTNYRRLILSQLFPDFHVLISGRDYSSSHHYEMLDPSFLEPERAGLNEMDRTASQPGSIEQLEATPAGKLFSSAELRNDMRLICAAYGEFNLGENPSYVSMKEFVTKCSQHSDDDYYIRLSSKEFHDLADTYKLSPSMRRALVQEGDDYVVNLDSYAPFITINGSYVATVSLLSRFIHQWKIRVLNRVRRFQIRSGYILEDNVKEELSLQGYRITDVKRINRSEFDVVAVFDDVIYNIQCKNNLVDYSRIEFNPKLFVRYNRQLDRYYANALAKEEAREGLLKSRLQLNKIVHVVVTRFPIATTNPRVVPFTRINQFRALVKEQGQGFALQPPSISQQESR